MALRTVKESAAGYPSVDGAGVQLIRVLGSLTVQDFDPFLMLDAFDSTNPEDYIKGFPRHPHRGIETFTYIMQGEVDHEDSLGNKGKITDNSCQWMTAGSGILHQEMPQASKRLLGLQLWINLPRKDKMVHPKYRDITPEMIPKIESDAGTVALVAGRYQGKDGATRGEYVDVRFLDIAMHPDKTMKLETVPEDTVFAYLVEGTCAFDEGMRLQEPKRAFLFSKGDEIVLQSGPQGARLVLVSGPPLREPVAWGGPIVMNTERELRDAFFELQNGTFIKHS